MLIEAEVLPGVKSVAIGELTRRFADRIDVLTTPRDDQVLFTCERRVDDLFDLKTVVALYDVHYFDIPRPKALLGHQHLTTLLKAIHSIRSMNPSGSFSSFRISAAGSDSTIFDRFKEEITDATGLFFDEEEADLFIRVRKAQTQPDGWEVLLRLTPRPLGKRPWRVCDLQGALHATLASAMVELSNPQPNDRVLNLMCGSGTLLIERAYREGFQELFGFDVDYEVLACAEENIEASGLSPQPEVRLMDVRAMDFLPGSFDVILADLPWGHLVNTPEEIEELYPSVLKNSAEIIKPSGCFVLITHALELFERTFNEYTDLWRMEQSIQVYQGGLHPRIVVLRRL